MKLLIILVIFAVLPAQAQFQSWSSRQGPSSLRGKSDNAYRDVWSLSDWFETQRKNRLMDQWLAMNSSSNPFEFYLGAQTTTYDSIVRINGVAEPLKEYRMNRAQIGAYASIIGLQAEYADSGEEFTSGEGSIHLRLLGRNSKGTNLTGFYGIRYRNDKMLTTNQEKFQQNFAGGSLTLNLIKYAGIIGNYKKYFKDKSDIGSELESERIEGTFFIDFAFLRVYGTWFQEKEEYRNIVVPSTKEIERDGIFGGIKLFF